MANKSLIPEPIERYIEAVSLREPPILQRLREETSAHPRSIMMLPATQGQFLGLLVQATGARKCLEVGVFTGYSSTSVALALPEDGRILACDISEEFTSTARRYWQEAGVSHKVELRIGPAADTLRGLLTNGEAGTFDFGFIDADKPGYPEYYELALQLLRPGGLLIFDNVLQRGTVADISRNEPNTLVMRAFNEKLHRDERVTVTLLPVGDGLLLAVKR